MTVRRSRFAWTTTGDAAIFSATGSNNYTTTTGGAAKTGTVYGAGSAIAGTAPYSKTYAYDPNGTTWHSTRKRIANVQNTIATIRQRQQLLNPGRVVSELTFGNWVRLLSTGGHRNGTPVDYTKVLWRPYLSPRFSGAASRQALHTEAEAVRTFRNRIAHHEPLLSIDHARMLQRAVDLTEIINPVVADELRANTLIGQFIRNRPRRSCVAGCDHPRL